MKTTWLSWGTRMRRHDHAVSPGLRLTGWVALVLTVSGCTPFSADEKIRQAADLVESQTGHRPAWPAPWDERPPPWDGTATLKCSEAVALALRNNRALRADLEAIGQADANLLQAGLLQNPRFNFMVMFPESGGRTMLRSAGFPMQALQDLWLRKPRQQAADAELQRVILRVADRAVETVAEVKALYARIQYAQRTTELIRENMAVVEQARRLILSQQAAGKATSVEASVAYIRHLRLQSDLKATDAEYRSLKRRLLLLMGFPAATDSWSVTAAHELHEPLVPLPDEDMLLASAHDHRLDLLAAQWMARAAEHEFLLARREAWPEVAVGLTFERSPAPRSQNQQLAGRLGNAAVQTAAGNAPEAAPLAPFAPGERDGDWMVGPMFEIELPIFDRNHAQIARALHVFRQRWTEYDAARQRITADVRESAVMYAQALEQVRFFRDVILPEVQGNIDVVRESYRAGRENVTVFLQIQEDLIMTRLNALAFLRDALVTRAELERRLGGRLAPSTPSDADLPGDAPATVSPTETNQEED